MSLIAGLKRWWGRCLHHKEVTGSVILAVAGIAAALIGVKNCPGPADRFKITKVEVDRPELITGLRLALKINSDATLSVPTHSLWEDVGRQKTIELDEAVLITKAERYAVSGAGWVRTSTSQVEDVVPANAKNGRFSSELGSKEPIAKPKLKFTVGKGKAGEDPVVVTLTATIIGVPGD